NAKRGVAPSSAGRASDGLPRSERLAVSGLGAALVGAANAGKLMLARSSRLSAAEGRRRDGNPRIITLPFSRALDRAPTPGGRAPIALMRRGGAESGIRHRVHRQ